MAQEEILILSTRGKDEICGEIWGWTRGAGHITRQLFPDEAGLLDFLAGRDLSRCRVVVDANLRRMHRRVLELASVPDLVIFDHDICQDHVRESEWYRKYILVLRSLRPSAVIVSSLWLRQRVAGYGLQAVYVPKAYSPRVIHPVDEERTIARGFVGRLGNKVYRSRRHFLEILARKEDVQLMRADYGEPYNRLLHRIRVFVSADIGFHEHMIKNFEAMAAGCTVLAARQGTGEEEFLGFEHGENIMLYDTLDEARACLRWLSANPARCERIGRAGQALVRERHTWGRRSLAMRDALQARPAPRLPAAPGLLGRLRLTRL